MLLLVVEDRPRTVGQEAEIGIALEEELNIGREGRRIVKEERRIEGLVEVGFGMKGSRSFVVGVGSRCCTHRIVVVRILRYGSKYLQG